MIIEERARHALLCNVFLGRSKFPVIFSPPLSDFYLFLMLLFLLHSFGVACLAN